MRNAPKSLKILKRNLYATILLALLLPVYTSEVLNEDPKTIGIIGAVMISLSLINLIYTGRIEKELTEDKIP